MAATYRMTVLADGRVYMRIDHHQGWWDTWTYDSWPHLLATQTFSPHARVFVHAAERRKGA